MTAELTTEQEAWLEAVRVQSQAKDQATWQRDVAIFEARRLKVPAPTIAAAAGLTRARIYQILERKP